jgi:rare lipoprotein A
MKLIFSSVICFFLLFSAFGQENAADFRQEGIASWYGMEFAGRPTASGEIFNPSDMTAAHPKLPFGTYLRVTNTHNGKQVVVRVNDRGPFAAARIIDLSQKAAEALDMVITGTAPVIVESVNMQPANERLAVPTQNIPVAPIPPLAVNTENHPTITRQTYDMLPVSDAAAQNQSMQQVPPSEIIPIVNPTPEIAHVQVGKTYRIQVGSYRNAKYAVDAFASLKNAGLTPSYERYNDLYRVVIAKVESNKVQSVVDTLSNAGFAEVLIKEEF